MWEGALAEKASAFLPIGAAPRRGATSQVPDKSALCGNNSSSFSGSDYYSPPGSLHSPGLGLSSSPLHSALWLLWPILSLFHQAA